MVCKEYLTVKDLSLKLKISSIQWRWNPYMHTCFSYCHNLRPDFKIQKMESLQKKKKIRQLIKKKKYSQSIMTTESIFLILHISNLS